MKKLTFGFALAITALIIACGDNRDCPDRKLYDFTQDCPEDTVWVCGCNGVTYHNECVANSRGAWVESQGPCQ